MFLQLVTTFLATYLSKNLKAYSLYDNKVYGRISYYRPPPPPQLCFSTSADYADEYYLRSLSNVTIPTPSLRFLNDFKSPSYQSNTTTSLFRVSALPRLFRCFFRRLLQIAMGVIPTAAEVVVYFLQALIVMGPTAAMAWALHEQRIRDQLYLKEKSVTCLLPFCLLAKMDNNKIKSISVLKAELERLQTTLESQKTYSARLSLIEEAQAAQLSSLQMALLEQHETSSRHISKLTQQCEAQRWEHGVLMRELQDIKAQEKSAEVTIKQLEVTLKRQNGMIKRREEDWDLQNNYSSAKFASYEEEIANLQVKIKATEEEAEDHITRAESVVAQAKNLVVRAESAAAETIDTARERLCGLEERLDAERRAGQESTKKLQADLETARGHMESILPTMRSNSRELQLYRDKEKAQATPGPSQHSDNPPPMAFTPPQRGMQSASGQLPFAPRPAHIPGFPPNFRSGFTESTPPRWGRGGGRGRARGGRGGGLNGG